MEIKKIANDNSRCAYLVGVRASVGIAGTLFPYLAISVRDENEAIAIADEILAPGPRGSISVTHILARSSSPANSNEFGVNAGVDTLGGSGVGPEDDR
ncbi:hypothetical protein IVB08_22100 [Bradyrhizobium sp. 173]|uniref:hypothetical protein n=1 Tax=Bradyrhizobium sp. 173 TaxID=2782644 RepID=UPI001FFB1692|nr:hypothetical protein [Bradyrhizobium sp. 173]MCK1566622.1 hypothetical protein [Bradyrhizobium sp. 173]